MRTTFILFLIALGSFCSPAVQGQTRFGLQAGLHFHGGKTYYQSSSPDYEQVYREKLRAGPVLGLVWNRPLNSWLSLNWEVNYQVLGVHSIDEYKSLSPQTLEEAYSNRSRMDHHALSIPVSLQARLPLKNGELFIGMGLNPVLGFYSHFRSSFEGIDDGEAYQYGQNFGTSFLDGLSYLEDNLALMTFADLGLRFGNRWEVLSRVSLSTSMRTRFYCPPDAICILIAYRRFNPGGLGILLRRYF